MARPSSIGMRNGGEGWVCSTSTRRVFLSGSQAHAARTFSIPPRLSHWSKNQRRSWPDALSMARRKSAVVAFPSR